MQGKISYKMLSIMGPASRWHRVQGQLPAGYKMTVKPCRKADRQTRRYPLAGLSGGPPAGYKVTAKPCRKAERQKSSGA